MAFSEIRVRMKDGHKLYSETKLASSNDVAFLVGGKMDGYRDNTIAVLNLNAKGQIISMDMGSLNHFRKHIRETVKRSILSNAGTVCIVANGADSSIKRTLAKEYQAVYEIFKIPMIDFICKDKAGQYMSYRAKDIINDASATLSTNFNPGTDVDIKDRYDIAQIDIKRISEIEGVAASNDAISHVQNELRSFDREVLYIICHDKYGQPVNYYMASMGDLSSSTAHPREAFKGAILSDAYSITMLHNHPSGDCIPSPADDGATLTMQYCGAVLGINLKDSLIVGKDVYSYEEQGRLLGQDGGYAEPKWKEEGNVMEIGRDIETNLNFKWDTGSKNSNAIKIFRENGIDYYYEHQQLMADIKKSGTYAKVGFKELEDGYFSIVEEKENGLTTRFTQTLLNYTENSGYTLEVHDGKLLIVDIEGPEPFWEETTLEYARENACSRIEEDIKENGEYYRKNGGLDALKDDLEFLRGYDIDAAEDTVFKELRQKTEFHMQKLPSFTQEQLPEQTAMNSFTGKDLQAEMTMEI